MSKAYQNQGTYNCTDTQIAERIINKAFMQRDDKLIMIPYILAKHNPYINMIKNDKNNTYYVIVYYFTSALS